MSKKNNDRPSKDNYYNYTSEAYDLYSLPEIYEDLSQKTTIRPRKTKIKKIKRPNEISVHSAKLYVTLGILFLFSVVSLSIEANISQKKFNISQVKEDLKEIKKMNIYLENELNKSLDLENVEKLASSRLGMQKPAPYQIVYINVPKQSFVTSFDNNIKQNNVSKSGFDILGVIKNLVVKIKDLFN